MTRPQPKQINLAGRYYVEPRLYEAERQAIFRRCWQMLGPASQVAIPGRYLAVEIMGWKLFVIRCRDGALRAFHNVCRHRGARLLEEGNGQCQILRCPYHLWIYDERGNLRSAPRFGDDPGFRIEDWPLEPVAVDTWRGLLFVAIAPETSLIEQLGDLPEEVADCPIEDFHVAADRRFVMRSNWKTYTDNFVEGYHIPGIHPSFIKVIDFDAFVAETRRGMVRMSAPQRDGSIYDGKWLWMWPNWTLSIFRGGMNTSRVAPLGVDSTELLYHFYFSDTSSATEAARARIIDINSDIVREDFAICEHTQRNYASGAYCPGPLSPRHEPGVSYFQSKVINALAPVAAQAAE
jgi:choline monooxygenase